MSEKVKTANTSKSDSIDGRGALADILKKMSPDSEKNILSMLSNSDPDLGVDLRQRLFTVDDVLNCDDRVMQEKLHQMSETEIAYLVAGKAQDFRDKIFKNISKGRGDIVLEEENLHKPMLKKDCETVTAEFFSYLRRKWESGELRIIGRDDDQYV
jgi:flagellar motor switch protein FliG